MSLWRRRFNKIKYHGGKNGERILSISLTFILPQSNVSVTELLTSSSSSSSSSWYSFIIHWVVKTQLIQWLRYYRTPYTFQLRQHSARPLCALIITVNILRRMVYRSVYCVLTLIPAEHFNKTECSSDNQLWITLVKNDVPQFAIYQIVAVFVENRLQ